MSTPVALMRPVRVIQELTPIDIHKRAIHRAR